MKIKEIIEKLQLKALAGQENLDVNVTGGYTSDLLSDVIANSKEGNLWITLQIHQNIIAVARLKDLAGIIIVNKWLISSLMISIHCIKIHLNNFQKKPQDQLLVMFVTRTSY